MTPLKIGDIEIHWLSGGDFKLDGGAMFGAVPKVLWQRRYPADAANCIPMGNDPLLVRTPESLIVIDTGLGNRLTGKQRQIYHVSSDWDVPAQLERLGYRRDDVDCVILTHGDFDHAGGIEMLTAAGARELTFPAATHVFQTAEWQDLSHPSDRAKATYLEENFDLLRRRGRLHLVDGDEEIRPGIVVRRSGGHTRGHQVVEMGSRGETALHLGDLCPTHAHVHPLWVMAYDNFPLEAIERKKQYLTEFQARGCWFTLYHDPLHRAIKIDAAYRIITSWPAAAGADRAETSGIGPAAG